MSRGAAGHLGPGGIWWNVATPASAVTRTVRLGANEIVAATALDPIRPMTATPTRPRRTMPPGRAGRQTPRKTTTGNCSAVRAMCRPGSNGPASRDARTPVSQAGSHRAPSRRTAFRRAPSLATAACPMGRCRTAAPRTAGHTEHLHTEHLRPVPRHTEHLPAVPRRTVACRTAAPRMAACRTAGCRMAAPCLMGRSTADRDPADSPGCRTGAGCRRTRTALAGRRVPARRAGPQAVTTGQVRPSRIGTPTAGAARRLAHRRLAHRCQAHRCQAHRCQAAPGLEDRPQVRLTGVRSPTTPQEYLGYLGYRRCASSRPQVRASTLLTAASGSGHRRGRHWGHRRGRRRNRRGR